jgi:hypothetical protein
LISLQTSLREEAHGVQEKNGINIEKYNNLEKIVASTENFIEKGIKPLIEFNSKEENAVLALAETIKLAKDDYKTENSYTIGHKILNSIANLFNAVANALYNATQSSTVGQEAKTEHLALFRGYPVEKAAAKLATSVTKVGSDLADDLNKSSDSSLGPHP